MNIRGILGVKVCRMFPMGGFIIGLKDHDSYYPYWYSFLIFT
jgi:hypothetical protein